MKISIKLGGFGSLLLLAFIILKLCGVIAWNWWWVFSPLWIPFGLVLIFLLIFAIGVGSGAINKRR